MRSKSWLCLIFVVIFGLAQMGLCHDALAARKRTSHHAPPLDRAAAYIIDANSGKVYFSYNPDKRLHPASLTKMMTLYLTFSALTTGQLQLNSRLTTSAHAASAAPTNLALEAGDVITVEDCIQGLVTRSANDAATVLAESIGGSESQFASLMTSTAHKLGMKNTTFRNASGLPNPGQISSARDMSILARALMKNFPQYFPYFSIRSFTYNGVTYGTHNHLMERYDGMDGIKTGYTNASGFNLVSTAKRNGARLIGVVFGGKTAASRDVYMEQILNQAFAQVKSPTGEVMSASNNVAPPAPPANDDNSTTTTTESGEGDSTPAPVATVSQAENTPTTATVTSTATTTTNTANVVAANDALPASEPEPVAQAQPALSHSENSWGIQIGAYAKKIDTERAISNAKKSLPILLSSAKGEISRASHSSGGKLYRARLAGLDKSTATQVCSAYKKAGKPCMILAPSS